MQKSSIVEMELRAKEIARRHIGHFGWHLPSSAESGTRSFVLHWDKEKANWKLGCPGVPEEVKKTVSSLEQAIEKSREWSKQLDEEVEDVEDGAELRENAEDSEDVQEE